MSALLALSRAIDALNTAIGKAARWLILVAVVISAGNAIIRKVFSTSSNAWLESQWLLFGMVFMFCTSYTLMKNGHIRIDIITQRLSKRSRDWIDVFGHLFFFFPFVILLLVDLVPFVELSWQQNEQSMNAGGLPVWPAKVVILVGFALLALQGVSELIKRIAVIMDLIPEPYDAKDGPH